MSSIAIASIYADLLGTYGDGGNVLALAHRARLRDFDVQVIRVEPGAAVPTLADIYVLGGGEDTAQVAACEALRTDGALAAAGQRGAAVLAICAGYQLLGEYFPNAVGEPAPGLGLLDIRTDRLPQRAVGELATSPLQAGGSALLDRDRFTGYENHAGGTVRGPGISALARVDVGVGNGDGTEGSVSGHIVGTYLHGPCLARNPDIADQLLSWALGRELTELVEPEVAQLRAERFGAVSETRR